MAAFAGNDGTVIEPGSFPTAKVAGGYDFVGDNYDAASTDPAKLVPHPDPDPLDCSTMAGYDGHGSHVAGTAAGEGVTSTGQTYTGPYNKAALKQTFDVEPGVAPQATLRAYRIFGCAGSVNDDIIVAAIDRAVSDGVNVINMSLGSSYGTADNLDSAAIDAATEAGTLVVVAAGNSGASSYLVGTPSTTSTALSVAAVDAAFKTFPAVAVTGAVTTKALVANGVALRTPITGQLVNVGLGCALADYAGTKGKIALSTRGVCDRIDRAKFADQAGALASIMINNDTGLPPYEGDIPGVDIPFIGVNGDDSAAFLAAAGKTVTLTASSPLSNPTYTTPADFTSNGPRFGDSAQKPDLAAPGVSIPSVASGTGTASQLLSGTSMAAPHTAGVAALVRQAHPTWSALQTKAVLMSTADPTKIGDYDSQRVGVGLVQPRKATVANTYTSTAGGLDSLKFGMNQLGGAYAETQAFRITNRTSKTVTYKLGAKVSGTSYGASLSLSPKTVKIKAGERRTVSLTIKLSASDVAKLPSADPVAGDPLDAVHGLVVATPKKASSSVLPLRTSFLFVPVPLSNITASASVQATGSGTYSGIKVRNTGAHTGTAELYSWLFADPVGDTLDLSAADVTNFGVQTIPGDAVGADATDKLLVFAASLARGVSNPATDDVDFFIDVDGDGKADFETFSADSGLATAGSADGTATTFTVSVATGDLVDAWTTVAPNNGSTLELPVLASSLAAKASTPLTISELETSSAIDSTVDQVDGTATFNPFSPALSQGDAVELKPGQSSTIPVTVDNAQLSKQTHPGWLVVTMDDRAGSREADRVKLLLPSAVAAKKKTG